MTPQIDTSIAPGAGRGRLAARALLALGAAVLLGGCVSARPWRDCLRPCTGRQLTDAEEVQVIRLDGAQTRLLRVRAGTDASGDYLLGTVAQRGRGEPVKLRIDAEVICSVRTRRVELGRVMANVVLVPIAVAANLAGFVIDAGDGEQEFEGLWILPTEAPPPESCTWLRPIPEAPAAAAHAFEENAEAPDAPPD